MDQVELWFQRWISEISKGEGLCRDKWLRLADSFGFRKKLERKFHQFDELCASVANADYLLKENSFFAGFRLIEKLGSGSYGVVWEAEDVSLKKRVALKILHPLLIDGEGSLELIKREARVACLISHPSVVQVFGVGESRGMPFLVMELVSNGANLASAISGKFELDWTLEKKVAEIAKLSSALHLANQVGVLHRDIKPSNILLDPVGTLKLSDFGSAQCIDKANKSLKKSGFFGTLAYSAPEVLEGFEASVYSDQWSLGLTALEWFVGNPELFNVTDFQNPQVSSPRIISGDLERLNLPPRLAAICAKAISHNPNDRYGCILGFQRDLESFNNGGQIVARPPTFLEKTAFLIKSNPIQSTIIFFVFLGGFIFAAWIKDSRQSEIELRQRFDVILDLTKGLALLPSESRISMVKKVADEAIQVCAESFDWSEKYKILFSLSQVLIRVEDFGEAASVAEMASQLDGITEEQKSQALVLQARALVDCNKPLMAVSLLQPLLAGVILPEEMSESDDWLANRYGVALMQTRKEPERANARKWFSLVEQSQLAKGNNTSELWFLNQLNLAIWDVRDNCRLSIERIERVLPQAVLVHSAAWEELNFFYVLLADAHRREGDLLKSINYSKKAIDFRSSQRGDNSPAILIMQAQLALDLYEVGEEEEAITLAKQVKEKSEKSIGEYQIEHLAVMLEKLKKILS